MYNPTIYSKFALFTTRLYRLETNILFWQLRDNIRLLSTYKERFPDNKIIVLLPIDGKQEIVINFWCYSVTFQS